VLEEILRKTIKVAEQAEVFNISFEDTPIEFENNRLKNVQTKQGDVTGLRIIHNGKIGYAVTSHMSNIDELINMARQTSEFGEDPGFDFPGKHKYTDVKVYDDNVSEIPLGIMIDIGNKMIANITDYNNEILCNTSLFKSNSKVEIINSNGGHLSYRKSAFSIGLQGILIRGTDMLFVGDTQNSCLALTDTTEIEKSVITQLERAKVTARVKSKQLPVIFTPLGVVSAIIPGLLTAFNGKVVLEGASPLGQSLRQKVFDSKLDLVDDATIDYATASQPADDEGVPTRQTILVKNGVVNSFFYDLRTAAKAGKESTGNGQRAGKEKPNPTINALVFNNGQTPFDDIVSSIHEGLIVEYTMGASQGNVLGGDFSGNILLGYKIESGKIVGRVKDTVISGNIYDMLKNIELANDRRWIGQAVMVPSIFCPDITVASN
jgi:PmbA protein